MSFDIEDLDDKKWYRKLIEFTLNDCYGGKPN